MNEIVTLVVRDGMTGYRKLYFIAYKSSSCIQEIKSVKYTAIQQSKRNSEAREIYIYKRAHETGPSQELAIIIVVSGD